MSDYPNGPQSNLKFILIPLAIGLVIFLGLGGAMLYLKGGSRTSKYNKAINDYNSGNYAAAAQQFEALGDYMDSKKRAVESTAKMHYTNGKYAFETGDYDKAVQEYEAAGDFEDAKERLTDAQNAQHYNKGVSLSRSGDVDGSIEEFKKANGSYDSDIKLFELYVIKGDKELDNKAFDKAMEYYKTAGTYMDSAEQIRKCYYFMGEDAESNNKLDDAVSYYVEAGDYKDAPEKIKAIYYNAGLDALSRNETDKAADYLRIAADYKDAASKGKEAFYLKGVSRLKAKDFENASAFFGLAGNYKNAKELSYVSDAEQALIEGNVSQAVSLYSKVSKKTKLSGFDIQGRKKHASLRLAIDKIHGIYYQNTYDIYVQKTWYTGGIGRYKKWYFSSMYYHIAATPNVVVNYDVNPDGTFNIYGSATFVKFVNYAETQNGLKIAEPKYNFRFNKVKKFPTTIKLASGTTLKYKNGVFTLTYAKNSKSGSGRIKNRSTTRYKK